jgi:hypothetical protein
MDGMSFLTVSDEAVPTTLRLYPRSTTTLAPVASGTPEQPPAAAPSGLAAFPAWAGLLAAFAGLGLAAAGLAGLRRSRRQLSV